MTTNPSNFFPGVVRTVADVAAISRGEAEIFELVREGEYAEALTAREIHLNGSADMGIHANGDLLLFVREGSGTLTVAGESFELSPDCAALIRDGEAWALSSTSPFKIFSVHVPGMGPYARKIAKPTIGFQRVVQQGITNKGKATGNREFEDAKDFLVSNDVWGLGACLCSIELGVVILSRKSGAILGVVISNSKLRKTLLLLANKCDSAGKRSDDADHTGARCRRC